MVKFPRDDQGRSLKQDGTLRKKAPGAPQYLMNAGKGRPKGSKNKLTADVKACILEAFHAGGGAKWLQKQMTSNPVAFMTLLGKVMPMQLEDTEGNPILIASVRLVGPSEVLEVAPQRKPVITLNGSGDMVEDDG